MGRPKDRIWNNAKDLKDKKLKNGFRCNFCSKDFSGGLSRLKAHLAGKKGHGIAICEKVTKEVQLDVSLPIEASTDKTLKSASTSTTSKKEKKSNIYMHSLIL